MHPSVGSVEAMYTHPVAGLKTRYHLPSAPVMVMAMMQSARQQPGRLRRILNATPLIAGLLPLPGCSEPVTVFKNPDTGLLTWSAENEGFSIELIQLVPDYVRAIYGSHDFPKAEIERIAAYCVFGTIVKNTSQQRLKYRVSDWYYVIEGDRQKHPVKTKSAWLEEWRKAGISFSWTLLPDLGTFEPGDWQQGFTTIRAPRDHSFDLVYSWTLGDKHYAARLEDLQCAPQQPGS